MALTKIKLKYRSEDGYLLTRYVVRDDESGKVSVFQVQADSTGREFGFDRFYHHPARLGEPFGGSLHRNCEFVGGDCYCDGTFTGRIDNEADRWREASVYVN